MKFRYETLFRHSWLGKAIAQKTVSKLGLLPLYYRLQQLGGRLKNFHPSARIEYAGKLYADVQPYVGLEGATLMEIGTGWVPVVPLALHLLGVKKVISFDLNRHLQTKVTLNCVSKLDECIPDLARRTGVEPAVMRRRLTVLQKAQSVDELFFLAGIEYRAPADASRTGLPSGSFDVVYSNLVLEHITPVALPEIHKECFRVLKPNGVAWHNIDYSDHYAATNSKISPINMLRYSDRFWSLFGQNDILYQNRLRRAHHAAVFAAVGFVEERCIDSKAPSILESLAGGLIVSPAYSGFSPSELEVISSRFVLKAAVLAQ